MDSRSINEISASMDTILIVDDEDDTRLLMRDQLKKEGYAILEATDGEAAQRVIEEKYREISAVILDWRMPKIHGIEVLEWMKGESRYEQIPIIMHTGLGEPEHIKRGIEAGAFYYLMKSTRPELLRSIVRTAVSDFKYKQALLKKIHDSENPYKLLVEGTFRFRTLEDGEYLALRIANASSAPDKAIMIAELLMNAIEHGNLGISYNEKGRLIADGTLRTSIEERLTLPEYSKKFVEVKINRHEDKMDVFVIDQGEGFDYKKYLTMDESRAFDNHGRGIAIANSTLDLEYRGNGNQVLITIPYTQ